MRPPFTNCRDDTLAISVASFLLLLLVNTTGFVLNASSIPDMWKGAFWVRFDRVNVVGPQV